MSYHDFPHIDNPFRRPGPIASIQLNRIACVGKLIGDELNAFLAAWAGRIGITLDELHGCLALVTAHDELGKEPTGLWDAWFRDLCRSGSLNYELGRAARTRSRGK